MENVIKDIEGAKIENNRFCISVHFRQVHEKVPFNFYYFFESFLVLLFIYYIVLHLKIIMMFESRIITNWKRKWSLCLERIHCSAWLRVKRYTLHYFLTSPVYEFNNQSYLISQRYSILFICIGYGNKAINRMEQRKCCWIFSWHIRIKQFQQFPSCIYWWW